MSRSTTAPAPAEICVFKCTCGRNHVVIEVEHYDRFILSCGVKVWALRPRRNGRLELRLWPGMPLTRWEMAEKLNQDAKEQRQ